MELFIAFSALSKSSILSLDCIEVPQSTIIFRVDAVFSRDVEGRGTLENYWSDDWFLYVLLDVESSAGAGASICSLYRR